MLWKKRRLAFHSFESSESVDLTLRDIKGAVQSSYPLILRTHAPSKKISNVHPVPVSACPRRSSSGAGINPRRRWSVPWFTAAENLWSRSFRRVPPVWEFVRGRSKRRKRARKREKEEERKGKRGRRKEREGYGRLSRMEGFNVANVYKYRHCTGAKGCIFHSLFVVAGPGFGIRTIVHFRGAICDRLASIGREEGEDETGGPVWPLKRSHDTGNISFRCTRSVSRETNRQRHRETVTRPLLYGLHTWAANLLPLWIFRRGFFNRGTPFWINRGITVKWEGRMKVEIIILLSTKLLKKKFVISRDNY